LWFLEYFACLPYVVYVFDGYVCCGCGCCADGAGYVDCSCGLAEFCSVFVVDGVVCDCYAVCLCEAVVLPYAFGLAGVVVYVDVGLCYGYVWCGPVVADVEYYLL